MKFLKRMFQPPPSAAQVDAGHAWKDFSATYDGAEPMNFRIRLTRPTLPPDANFDLGVSVELRHGSGMPDVDVAARYRDVETRFG